MKLELPCLIHGRHLRTLLVTSRRIEKQDRHGSRQRRAACVSRRSRVHCLLPVVLMPPTVRQLQAQLVGYLLGLYTAAPSFPSVLLSLPPAVCANSPSVALIPSFPRAWTHANVSKHVCTLYILIVRVPRTLHTSSLCENITYSSDNKAEAGAAVLFLGQATFYPTCPWYVEQW